MGNLPRDIEVNLIGDKQKSVNRWKQYFEKLLNTEKESGMVDTRGLEGARQREKNLKWQERKLLGS